MATQLFKTLGTMEHSNDGSPLGGGRVYPQQNDTSAPANTYLDSAGATVNSYENDSDGLGPYILLDANGRYPESVFLTDSTVYAAGYKFVVRDSGKAIQYTASDIPAATPELSNDQFAAELVPWQQKTFSDSPINLTAANAGSAYEIDTTGGNVVINLPSAASTGNGKGFIFKKTISANTVTINRAGSDGIDGATSVVLYAQYTGFKISSNGATWRIDRKFFAGLNNLDFRSGAGGGRITLGLPESGSTIAGTGVLVSVDSNQFRFFENGGTNRGIGFDITTAAAAAASVGFHSGNAATQAQMETGTSLVVPVVPGRQHSHPGHPKAWGYIVYTAGAPALSASYNVANITDGGVGLLGITLATSFTNPLWADPSSVFVSGSALAMVTDAKTSGSVTYVIRNLAGAATDPAAVSFVGLGDQP